MKQIKVSEATELQLDWLVAKCVGQVHKDQPLNGTTMYGWWISGLFVDPNYWIRIDDFKPSTNAAHSWPIIDRELTKVFRNVGGTWSAMILKEVPIPTEDRGTSLALARRAQWNGAGITSLIAAMRCYVASKLGDTVEVPDELV